jgi:hypothetical protein
MLHVGYVMFSDPELSQLDFTIDAITLNEEFVSKLWPLAKLVKTWKLRLMESTVSMSQRHLTSRQAALLHRDRVSLRVAVVLCADRLLCVVCVRVWLWLIRAIRNFMPQLNTSQWGCGCAPVATTPR